MSHNLNLFSKKSNGGVSPSNNNQYSSLFEDSEENPSDSNDSSGNVDSGSVNILDKEKMCTKCQYKGEDIHYCNNDYYCWSCIDDLQEKASLTGFCTRENCNCPSDDLELYKGDLLCEYCTDYMYILEDNFKDKNDVLMVKEIPFSSKNLSSDELLKRACFCCEKNSTDSTHLYEINEDWLNTRISNQEYNYKDEDGVMQCYKYICTRCLYKTCMSCLKSDVGEILGTKDIPSENHGYGNINGMSCTRRCEDCWSFAPGKRGYCSLCKDYDYLDGIKFDGEFEKDENGNDILYCCDCIEFKFTDTNLEKVRLKSEGNDFIPNRYNDKKCCGCGTCSRDESEFYKKACRLDIYDEWLFPVKESKTEDLKSIMFRPPIEGSCKENGEKSLRHILCTVPDELIRHITTYLNRVDECVPNKFIRLTDLSTSYLSERNFQDISIERYLFSLIEDDQRIQSYTEYFVCWQCFMSTLFLHQENIKTLAMSKGYIPKVLPGGRTSLQHFLCFGLICGTDRNFGIDYSENSRIRAIERNKERVLKLIYPNTYRLNSDKEYKMVETYDDDRNLSSISINSYYK